MTGVCEVESTAGRIQDDHRTFHTLDTVHTQKAVPQPLSSAHKFVLLRKYHIMESSAGDIALLEWHEPDSKRTKRCRNRDVGCSVLW